jgi:FkbH-like protein
VWFPVLNSFGKYPLATSLRDLQNEVRAYAAGANEDTRPKTKIRLAVTGNYSTQFLAAALPMALAACGVDAAIYESGYNQWQLDLRDPGSRLYSSQPTHILVLLTSIELAFSSGRTAEEAVEAISASIEAALGACSARILLTLPEPLIDEASDQTGAYRWRQDLNRMLRERLASDRISLIDMDGLVRQVGADRWFDDRFYDLAKLPFHPDCTPLVLRRLSHAVSGVVRAGCKLVIVDLDDTLWGGRVGDDGWEGIDIDPAGTGRHFLRLQSFLKAAQANGVLLAIASKNNESSVDEVFEKRKEMMISRDDFVTAEIHWEQKSASVSRILERLNLSTAGIVFLDDNPAEREEVGRVFPELIIPDLPEDPAERVPYLISTGLFDRRVVTSESTARHQMYLENEKREEALRRAGGIDDFLKDLEMVMDVLPPERARDRVLELIQKTNQFNLTTARFGWSDLAEIMSRGFVVCYRLKDKFGDNGIISVAAVDREGDDARIALWLMSCRVLGRKVEEAILADVAARARANGAQRLVGEYWPTNKNGIVSDLYPRLGFAEVTRDSQRVSYAIDVDDKRIENVKFIAVSDTTSGT